MTRDRGAAAVWVLACAALVLAVAMVVVVRALAVLARHRAETAADLAALAAAGRIGLVGDPCAAARTVAEANGADLTACDVRLDPSARSGIVRVRVVSAVRLPLVGAGEASGHARAARLPGDATAVPVHRRAALTSPSPSVPRAVLIGVGTCCASSVWHAGAGRNRSEPG